MVAGLAGPEADNFNILTNFISKDKTIICKNNFEGKGNSYIFEMRLCKVQ